MNLPALTRSEILSETAQSYSIAMCRHSQLSHTGQDGSSFVDRLSQSGYRGLPRGENIALGYRSARTVVGGWVRSDGHRRNMLLPDIDEVGIGIAVNQRTGEMWWTMLLGVGNR
jgi:uncharacterized protein YkwD